LTQVREQERGGKTLLKERRIKSLSVAIERRRESLIGGGIREEEIQYLI